MFMLSTKTRCVLLAVVSFILCYALIPIEVQAEQIQRTITITEQQEWGQIIVESNVEQFEVDIITPDGTRWSHTEETDVDVLFYYSFEHMRHWAAEIMKAGSYQVIIDGPADASYTVRNQDSYSQLEVKLITPSKQTIVVTEQAFTFEATWSYTGDILRNNSIDFYLVPADGGDNIELGRSSASLKSWSLSLPNDLIDGNYKLLVLYDNNTSELVSLDPEVTFQVKRGFTGEKVDIIEVSPAGADVYAELQFPHSNIQGVDVSLVESDKPGQFQWTRYELSELTKLPAPAEAETQHSQDNDDHRYSIFMPTEENGSYKLAVRLISSSGMPGPISISDQQVEIMAKEWPEDLVSWSLPDGVTNVEYAELTVTYHEPISLQLMADGQLVAEHDIDSDDIKSATEPWVMHIPLSEGEHSYELVLYDDYGNYFTDGRIWTVDHTAPRLEMIGPLASHSRIPSDIVSGWTEKNVTLRINDQEVEVDGSGYFQLATKASTIDIVVADESGNETVYHWSTANDSNGLTLSQWILLISGLIIILGVAVYLFLRDKK